MPDTGAGLSDRGRPIHGPAPPGQGVPCSRQSPLTGAEVAEVAAIIAGARRGRHAAELPERLRTRGWDSVLEIGDCVFRDWYGSSGFYGTCLDNGGGAAMGHPVTSLTWMLNWARAHGRAVRAGVIVSTGTCTGHLVAAPGDTVRAGFGPLGVVEAHFA